MRVGTISSLGCSITIAGVARLKGGGVGGRAAAAVGGGSTTGASVGGEAGWVMLSGVGDTLEQPTSARVRRRVLMDMRSMDLSNEIHANL